MATNKSKPIPELSPSEVARFWASIKIGTDDQCWPWNGKCFRSGYGRWRFDCDSQSYFKSSRIAFMLSTGKDPGDFFVCHSCDNPPCCNPSHLSEKPPAGNSRDMVERNRAASGDRNGLRLHPESILRGESHPCRIHDGAYLKRGKDHWTNQHPEWISGDRNPAAKLSQKDVQDIRQEYAAGEILQSDLAKRYGVCRQTIMKVVHGASHKFTSTPEYSQ